ncbi:MAG: hypothetical protein ACRC68_01025 [Clostridium sp.]
MKIPISFKKEEEHIYNYIKSKRNASVYIKDLVEEEMNNKNIIKEKTVVRKKEERVSGNLELDF